jgi:SAM-dependent methyltransferase
MLMSRAGIAVITYRRPSYLEKTLRAIRRATPRDRYHVIVVSDDEADSGTRDVCRQLDAPLLSGHNRGVVWNKNRGLYYFMSTTDCDPIILLEDDTYPKDKTWLSEWIEAASLWHHVNFTHPGLLIEPHRPIAGQGRPKSPYVHKVLTGQCTAVSRAAMQVGGYLDTRFRGYGHGHVEWTKRHAGLLYEGLVEDFSPAQPLFLSIVGGLVAEPAPTFRKDSEVQRNATLLRAIAGEPLRYVDPWQSDSERETLTAEIESGPKLEATGTSKFQLGEDIHCIVDALTLRGSRLRCVGWAKLESGGAVAALELRCNGRTLEDHAFSRVLRPDVARILPGAAPDCGFEITCTLPVSATAPGSCLDLQLLARFAHTASEATVYARQFRPPRMPPGTLFSLPDLEKWQGRNLYFGNIYPHERQFNHGNFVGLSLVPMSDRDLVHNAYEPLPVADATVARIQAQDVFEHLEFDRIPQVMDEIHRVLAPGGVFRLSVPDYRSPVLKGRSVYDENGNVIADLMMGGSVTFDKATGKRRVDFLDNGDAHLWFPTFERIADLIARSRLSACDIKFHHYFRPDGTAVCDEPPDLDMPVRRAPPFDMRAAGLPISIIVDFCKRP